VAVRIGIRRAILCTTGLEAFWCLLGFPHEVGYDDELGGFTLVLWWHWEVREVACRMGGGRE
jgi:hypothetical protein